MYTAIDKSQEKKEKKDKRKISIIHIARKTGVILGDGEYWDGTERRSGKKDEKREKRPKKEEKKPEKGKKDTPTDFFG